MTWRYLAVGLLLTGLLAVTVVSWIGRDAPEAAVAAPAPTPSTAPSPSQTLSRTSSPDPEIPEVNLDDWRDLPLPEGDDYAEVLQRLFDLEYAAFLFRDPSMVEEVYVPSAEGYRSTRSKIQLHREKDWRMICDGAKQVLQIEVTQEPDRGTAELAVEVAIPNCWLLDRFDDALDVTPSGTGAFRLTIAREAQGRSHWRVVSRDYLGPTAGGRQ